MSRIKSKNTSIEVKIRKLIYSMGYRYRLHDSKLPGKPDIVFRGRKKVIFVNGCFWHGHEGCKRSSLPNTRPEFWMKKIGRNIERDQKNYIDLQNSGWKTLVIWQCEMKNIDALAIKVHEFIESS